MAEQISGLSTALTASAGTAEYFGNVRSGATSTAGSNFHQIGQGSRLSSIVYGGIEYRLRSFWNADFNLCVGISKNRGSWTFWQTTIATTDINDSHYITSAVCDPDGYIHIFYNVHSEPIKRRVSVNRIDAFDGAFGSEVNAIGSLDVTNTTYPTPFLDTGDTNLWCEWREDNGSADARLMLAKYDHTGTPAWNAPTGISSGVMLDGAATSDVPYFSCPITTPDWDGAGTGYMWFVCNWRPDQLDNDSYHDITAWKYNGTSITKPDGSAQTVPITIANAGSCIIDNVAGANGLSAVPKINIDKNGRPFVLYAKNVTGTLTMFLRVWNGSTWDSYNPGITLLHSTLFEIVIDDDLVCHLIYRDASDGYIKEWYSGADSYSATFTQRTIFAQNLNGNLWHPCYDPGVWRRTGDFQTMIPYTATEVKARLGLSSHWKLNEASGSRVATLGGAGTYDLTDNNTVTSATGKIGDAAHFVSGNSEYLAKTDNASLSPTGSFSFSLWIKFNTINSFNHILSKYNTAGNRTFLLSAKSSSMTFGVSSDGTNMVNAVSSGFTPSTGVWYHVVAVCDVANDVNNLYVDGSLVGTVAFTGTPSDNAADFRVGVAQGSSSYVTADIDELAYYNGQALTLAEVQFLHNSGNAQPFELYGMIAPSIRSHGSTASVDVDAGNTAVATISAWGDLPMSEALTGTDAADFNVTDNGDGTWALAFDAPATAGSYEVILTLTNDAGSDAVTFTVNVASEGGSQLGPAFPSAISPVNPPPALLVALGLA